MLTDYQGDVTRNQAQTWDPVTQLVLSVHLIYLHIVNWGGPFNNILRDIICFSGDFDTKLKLRWVTVSGNIKQLMAEENQ